MWSRCYGKVDEKDECCVNARFTVQGNGCRNPSRPFELCSPLGAWGGKGTVLYTHVRARVHVRTTLHSQRAVLGV